MLSLPHRSRSSAFRRLLSTRPCNLSSLTNVMEKLESINEQKTERRWIHFEDHPKKHMNKSKRGDRADLFPQPGAPPPALGYWSSVKGLQQGQTASARGRRKGEF